MWPFPEQKDFLKMLSDQADKTEEGLGTLVDFLKNPSGDKASRMHLIEKEADETRRRLIEDLNRSFVTPIDREDIFALSRSIDDVVDYADSTVEEMTLFKIEPDGYITKMVDTLFRAAQDLNYAVKNLKKNPKVCSEYIMRVKKAENFVETCYREGLVELFKTNDVIKILKTREVYRHLSNAADRAAASADIISDILVKIT